MLNNLFNIKKLENTINLISVRKLKKITNMKTHNK